MKRLSMADVTAKPVVYREATAVGRIRLRPETVRLIREGGVEKGKPIGTAEVAAVLAAKSTSSLIPLCHPIPITEVDVESRLLDDGVEVRATVKAAAKTGVEMEALVAVSTALLTVWDMVKRYEKDEEGQYPTTIIQGVRVVKKLKAE
ncbi:MAG: cyclic pyranopterin monophosphate synthase MoaC [Candidatus Bathyarchaeia archaeon]